MSEHPTPAQFRGARGMLNWGMLDLAEAALLSVSTIKRMETDGAQAVSDRTLSLARKALEAAGVVFLPDDGKGAGVRWLPP